MKQRQRHSPFASPLPRPLTVPDRLPARGADELLRWLRELVDAIEEHYADELACYRRRPDPRQQELWAQRDPPF